ncbi:MAG: 7TM diverse intracellular signaling domain-containing protein [Candidatus Cyclobacteriaceae bacterium M2_1C_046]
MRSVFFYFAFLFIFFQAKADNPEVHDGQDQLNLNSHMVYLKNTGKKLSFEEALEALDNGQFAQNFLEQPINFGYDTSDFWFYTEFEVLQSMDRVLYFPYPYYQNMDVYIHKGQSWQKISTGNLKLFETRGSFKPENFAWPFSFEAGSNVQVMVNINSRAPTIMSLQVLSDNEYISTSNTQNLLYGMFFGILIIMVLYNFFLYIIIRDTAYLYYVILVLANIAVFGAVSGYAFHYLYPTYPQINFFIREFLITFLIIPSSLFAISFLNLKQYSKLLYKILWGMIVIGSILSVLALFGIIFGFSSMIISIHAPLLLLTGIVVRVKGNTTATFYILAWTGYLMGGMAMTLRNVGILPATFLTDHGAEIGAVLDVFLLALALAYRYKQIRNEKSKLHRENLELVEKQNLLLEQRVKERTKVLNSTLEIVQKQHDELNYKNLAINSSMNYALKIQEAMFPERHVMAPHFKDLILFAKPKQTVSGDFMFFESINNEIFIAVVDCTGHGVPGALMSMAGYNMFYDAINVEKLNSPRKILSYVEQHLHLRLRQNDELVKDGMEVALCIINKSTREVKFCGAQRPLLMVTLDKKIKLIKGTKKAIGGHFQNLEESFHEHMLSVEENTTLYLYTDGFQDQFGGEADKKFLSKRLKSLLSDISHQDGIKQEQLLKEEFESWRGNREQIDDVLVLGIKI